MIYFLENLELIKSRVKVFTWKLAEKSGKKKKFLGVIWMTATIHRDFELFRGLVCLHKMKRGIKKYFGHGLQ